MELEDKCTHFLQPQTLELFEYIPAGIVRPQNVKIRFPVPVRFLPNLDVYRTYFLRRTKEVGDIRIMNVIINDASSILYP